MAIQDHPNSSALQTEFQSVYTKVAAKQVTFLASNSRYWRGAACPATVQSLDDSKRNLENVMAVGETDDWDAFLGEILTVWGTYEVDSYSGGSDGDGWLLRIKIDDGADIVSKEEFFGNRSADEYSDYGIFE